MRRTNNDMQEIRQAVAEYVSRNGITNTRDIAEAVCSQLGVVPSTGTVSMILHELGYIPNRQPSFVWRHKKSHE